HAVVRHRHRHARRPRRPALLPRGDVEDALRVVRADHPAAQAVGAHRLQLRRPHAPAALLPLARLVTGAHVHSALVVNMASESDISVQGHGVHTAYVELASALERRDDVTLVRGRYRKRVDCDVYHLHTLGSAMWRKILDPGAKKVVSAH